MQNLTPLPPTWVLVGQKARPNPVALCDVWREEGKRQDLTPLPCAMYGERRAKGKT
jgi:acetyl esterase/lipase